MKMKRYEQLEFPITFRYRFKIIIQEKYMKKASRLMRTLDLDIGEVGIEHIFTFTSEKDFPISQVKEDIRKCFEDTEIELLFIEGGKIE